MVYEIIKALAKKDRIFLKKHSILRMYERNILADDVKKALINGEIIEHYPDDRPLPSYLVLGYAENKRTIHTVVAVDTEEQLLWVITVYEPNLEEWEPGFQRRRHK